MGDYFLEKKLRMVGCLETIFAFCFERPKRALDAGASMPSAIFLFGVFFEKINN